MNWAIYVLENVYEENAGYNIISKSVYQSCETFSSW